jgi:hypothetical protein
MMKRLELGGDAKRPVHLLLREETVAQAHQWTDNLSDVVERLLLEFVEQQRRQCVDETAALRRAASAWAAYAQREGHFADEFSTL